MRTLTAQCLHLFIISWCYVIITQRLYGFYSTFIPPVHNLSWLYVFWLFQDHLWDGSVPLEGLLATCLSWNTAETNVTAVLTGPSGPCPPNLSAADASQSWRSGQEQNPCSLVSPQPQADPPSLQKKNKAVNFVGLPAVLIPLLSHVFHQLRSSSSSHPFIPHRIITSLSLMSCLDAGNEKVEVLWLLAACFRGSPLSAC